MGTKKGFTLSIQERRNRSFSDSFKLQKVRDIQQGKCKVSEVCKQYEVSSTNVYRWIDKFGVMKNKTERIIVETQSDTQELLRLKNQLAELERLLGRKQIELEFTNKLIEIAEEKHGIEIKKKTSTTQSAGIGNINTKTPGA